MNTSQLKIFAQESRKSLMDSVKNKIDYVLAEDSIARRESQTAISALEGLIKEIGLEQVIEKVAYTWFNRFCALRFMDANHYNKIGIVSPAEGQTQPEILAEAKMNYIDESVVSAQNVTKVRNLLNGAMTSSDPQSDAYKLLLVSYCNSLHKQLPFMFERINDYTELLMPDDLLSTSSVLTKTVEILDADTCKDVEVIGWLYQYYISEKKDEVFADLKKGKKISKENVPAATQIFTPKWIVSYMVENSVGKLWLESHPDERLQSQFKYYLESAEQEDEVKIQLEELKNKDLKPQDIKVLDPACGSGHILVTAFSVLFEIYKSQGWQENEIPEMILKHNLYGLDICDRAAQLAQFAVMMKARVYDRGIFNKVSELNICSIKDTNWLESYVVDEILLNCNDKEKAKGQIELLRNTFKDAKEYGSILEVKDIDFNFWNEYLDVLKQDGQIRTYTPMIKVRLPYTLKQAKIMQQQYECVIANPPYMGSGGMSSKLLEFIKCKYPNSKLDLFAVFKEVITIKTKRHYYNASINQHSWMFQHSYQALREQFFNHSCIDTMVHLGSRAFEEISGEVVQSTTYVTIKNNLNNYIGKFVRLVDFANPRIKEQKYLEYNDKLIYHNKLKSFKMLPEMPIAYWIKPNIFDKFKKSMKDVMETKTGLVCGNNEKYIRFWYEVINRDIIFDAENWNDTINQKWFPYNHGGTKTKWYGDHNEIVYLKNSAKDISNEPNSMLRNKESYFQAGITWNRIGKAQEFAARIANKGFVYDDVSPMGFTKIKNEILAFLNSKVFNDLLKIFRQGFKVEKGQIDKVPYIEIPQNYKSICNSIVNENISISKDNWDSFETSWDFQEHPLLRFKENGKVSDSFNKWKEYKQEQFNKLKANEEELNKLFIEIYGLKDEMDEKVEDKDITLKGALETEKDCIKSLLSYAVGCMFGRYSLDEKGLVFAGGNFDKSRYAVFPADEDAVIPVLAEHMFSDDITSRFKDFLKAAFGTQNFEENLEYVANVLGKKNTETADDTIRNYFMKDFYKDHIQMYQKRPIYWMFSSAKGNFNALVYMHRYNKDTASVILNSYLRNYRDEKLKAKIENCKAIELSASSSQSDKIKAQKQREEMEKIVKEVSDWEHDVLYPLATERKEIDLDDGVKVNYLKFGKALKDFGLKAK